MFYFFSLSHLYNILKIIIFMNIHDSYSIHNTYLKKTSMSSLGMQHLWKSEHVQSQPEQTLAYKTNALTVGHTTYTRPICSFYSTCSYLDALARFLGVQNAKRRPLTPGRPLAQTLALPCIWVNSVNYCWIILII